MKNETFEAQPQYDVAAPKSSLLHTPELLAPAGNRDAFFAALAAGADAVYLGASHFNARRGADNFSLEELRELCDIAHVAGRRVYLTLNTAIRNSEFDEALELARQAWMAGVDSVIVHDLGLIRAIARGIPSLTIHASTQLSTHSSAGVAALASLGVTRITFARELNVAQITEMAAYAASLGVETEVFLHGALCFSYSGHCLMSSMIGRRSANRGLCAQPCRLPWKLIDTSTMHAINTPGEHLLSMGDLCALPLLDELTATGVSSLKIEGRMKSASYVSTVVRTYRDVLNGPTGVGSAVESAGDDLAEVFSRTLTTAYLGRDRSNAIMSYQRPNNRGVLVGRISEARSRMTSIELSKAVHRGDVLEVWTSKGNRIVELERFYAEANPIGTPLSIADAQSTVYLEHVAGALKGDRVFRVKNSALEKEAQKSLEGALFAGNNGLVPVAFNIEMLMGQALTIHVKATDVRGKDYFAIVKGPALEAARTRALTVHDVTEHIGRVGGTPFTVLSCDVSLDEGVGMGFSALHATRAQALDKLKAAILEPWHKRRLAPAPKQLKNTPRARGVVQLAVLVRDEAGARAAVKAGADVIYGHVLRLDAEGKPLAFPRQTPSPHRKHPTQVQTGEATNEARARTLKVTPHPWLPAIIHDAEAPTFSELMVAESIIVANSLGELESALAMGAHVESGPSLPLFNQKTLDYLAEKGVRRSWLGPELSYEDIEQMAPSSPLPLGLTVSGYQELMISEHCILMAQGDCTQNCKQCVRRRASRLLEDRKGYRFPVRTDEAGRSHLYNAVPLDLLAEIPRLMSLGITSFLVDATLLSTSEIITEVERAKRAVNLAVRGAGSLPKREGYTTGHLYRGML